MANLQRIGEYLAVSLKQADNETNRLKLKRDLFESDKIEKEERRRQEANRWEVEEKNKKEERKDKEVQSKFMFEMVKMVKGSNYHS